MRNFKYSIIASITLTIALAACGGDSGTSVNDDNVSSSSSSSVIPASSGNRPSSSSKKIASSSSTPRNDVKSSSSKRSEGDPSSSSQKITSSSSVKTVSSSSVALSSSSKQSSSSKKVESSSSSLRLSSANLSSSSKKVESSSSEYIPFDHSHALAADWRIGENRYKTFVDPRNGRSYYYITIPGRVFKEMGANGKAIWTEDTVTVMAENLNVGKMVLGEDDQNDDGEIERYCYNNDTTYCDEFGGLYQWAEMMQLPSRCNTESCAELIQKNHRGICPEGWRLMTFDDYKIIENADGNEEHGIAGLRSGYRFNGYNTTGFSLVGAGYRSEEKKFENLNEYAFWFFPTEKASEKAYVGLISITNDDGISESDWSIKQEGLSVRCVKLE